ncbi:MAG: phage tail tape measure protein [Fusobacteriaceae bacterium]
MNDDELSLKIQIEANDKVSSEVVKIQKELEKLLSGTKQTRDGIENFSQKSVKSLKKIENSMKEITKISGIALATIGVGATIAIKKFSDFESSVLNVMTVSKNSFNDIGNMATKLSIKYGEEINSILNANYNLVSSMGDINEKELILDKTLQLSKAGRASYAGTLSLTTKILNSYGLSANEVNRVTDILIQTQNKGVTTIGELESQLGRVIPTAANYKVSLEEIASIYATLTSKGQSTEQATTSLDSLLNELGNSSSRVAKEFLKLSGKSFSDFIKNGGTVSEVVQLIGENSLKTGATVESLFKSIESKKSMSTLFNNMDTWKEKIKDINNSNGQLEDSYKTIENSAKQSFSQLKEQANAVAIKFGEALIPSVKELLSYLQKLKWDEIFSQKNIDNSVSIGKSIVTISTGIIALNVGVKTLSNLITAKAFLNSLRLLMMANPAVTGAMAVAGGIYNLNALDKNNSNDLKKIKEENKENENRKSLLKAIQDDLNKGIINPGMLDVVDGFERLEILLKKGDIQSALKEIDYELNKKTNLSSISKNNDEAIQEHLLLLKAQNEFSNKSFGTSSSNDISILKREIEEMYTGLPSIWEALKIDDISILKEKLEIVKSLIKSSLEKGTNEDEPESFKNLLNEQDSLIMNIKLKTEEGEFQSYKKNIELELEKLLKISNFLGLTEDEELEEKVRTYTKNLTEMIEKGFDETKPELFAKLKLELETIQKQQDKNYDNKTQKGLLESNIKKAQEELAKEIDEQADAYIKTINEINNFGNSLYQVGQSLENDFIKSLSAVINSLGSMGNALVGADGKSGILGSVGGMANSGATIAGKGSAIGGAISTAMPYVGLATATLGLLGSFGKKDKSAEIKAKNQEQMKQFEQNTNALMELQKSIEKNTGTIRNLSNQLIKNVSKNPTLNHIFDGTKSLEEMERAIEANKNFGAVTAIARTYTKTGGGLFKKKKKKEVLTEIGITEQDLLNYTGLGEFDDVENLSNQNLKLFSERIKKITNEDLSNLLGKEITTNNLNEYKKLIDEYIGQIDMLKEEQKDFFKAATFESFQGIEYLDTKQLKQEYIEMFKGMGIDTDEYADVIDRLVKSNNVLITSMQSVRGSLVSGEKTFTESMESYFSSIVKNVNSILYDVMFNDIDKYYTDVFKGISEKLLHMKEQGITTINAKDIFEGFDFSKLIEGDKLQKEMQEKIKEIKKYLLDMGLDLEFVESMFGEKEYKEKINKLVEYLSNAMNDALSSDNFNDFSKSLGRSLYENVKDGLINAFAETELYKGMIDKFMITDEFKLNIESAGSFESAFNLIKQQLEQYSQLLEGNGLGFDFIGSDDEISKNSLSNSGYYTESKNEIKIEIVQQFNGSFYSENIMYDIAKKGAKDGMRELNEKGQILTSF